MQTQSDINDICGDILSNGKHLGDHQSRIKALMEHFSKAGTPLATVASKRYMDRSPDTIKRYCREHQIALSDWIPTQMRPKKQ